MEQIRRQTGGQNGKLRQHFKPKDHMPVLAPTLPDKYSPLQPNGNGNQCVYLAPVPEALAAALCQLLGGQVEQVIGASFVDFDLDADREQQRIAQDATISETERIQIINARVGQGLFRSRVELAEPTCRITGVGEWKCYRHMLETRVNHLVIAASMLEIGVQWFEACIHPEGSSGLRVLGFKFFSFRE